MIKELFIVHHINGGFIKKHVSNNNNKRLIYTDPERPGSHNIQSTTPSVLISPSLHTGLDLKDER